MERVFAGYIRDLAVMHKKTRDFTEGNKGNEEFRKTDS